MPYASIRDHMRYQQIGPIFRMKAYAKAGLFTKHLFTSRGTPLPLRDDVIQSFGFSVNNKPGKMGVRGARPNQTATPDLLKMSSGLLRVHDFTPFNNEQVQMFARSPQLSGSTQSEAEYDRVAEAYVNKVIEMGANQTALTKELAFACAAVYGILFVNSSNDIVFPTVHATTGAVTPPGDAARSYDFGVPDDHRGDLDGIVTALWSTAGTKISEQLEALRVKAIKDGKSRPDTILVPSIQKKWLRLNTEFKDWATYNNRSIEAVLGGGMIEDLWGWKWIFTDEIYQSTVDGTSVRETLPLVNVHIYSSMEDTIEVYEGRELLHFGPSGILQAGNADLSSLNITELFGDFAYTFVQNNPLSLEMHRGSNFGINITRAALYTPTVFAS